LLLRVNDLAEAGRWASVNQDEILPTEVEYLRTGRSLFERERRARRLSRLIAILWVVAAVLAVIASFWLLAISKSHA
jgi:hypothetical protein